VALQDGRAVLEPLAGLPVNNGGGTIVVRGFQHPISKEMMELYFTNSQTSGGGDITDIMIDVMTTKEVFIVFADHKGVAHYLPSCSCNSISGLGYLLSGGQ